MEEKKRNGDAKETPLNLDLSEEELVAIVRGLAVLGMATDNETLKQRCEMLVKRFLGEKVQ